MVLAGPPNTGKTSILVAATKAEAKVADYPFTTTVPQPGMWFMDDVQLELVDTPPFTADHVPPGLMGTFRNADLVCVVVEAGQAALAQAVRAFVANECPREEARALDARSAFPAEPVRQLGALGLYGLNVPEEFGGAGLDLLATALVIAELAQSAPVLAIAFSGVALRGSRAIAEWGSPAQQQALFPLLTSGETCLTFAAGPEDDPVIAAIGAESEFRLDGLAQHVALAVRAHALLTLANTSAGLTVFVVPTSSTGLVLSPVDKVGTRGVSLSRVRYDHVRVTPEQMVELAQRTHASAVVSARKNTSTSAEVGVPLVIVTRVRFRPS